MYNLDDTRTAMCDVEQSKTRRSHGTLRTCIIVRKFRPSPIMMAERQAREANIAMALGSRIMSPGWRSVSNEANS